MIRDTHNHNACQEDLAFMLSASRVDQGRPRRSWFDLPRALLITSMAALSLSGCASRVHTPYVASVTPAMFHRVAAEDMAFDYPDHGLATSALDGDEADGGDYWITSLETHPADGRNRDPLTARYYQGKGRGAKPLVIVLPVWGVSAYPSDTIVDGLRARAGGAVNILQVDGERLLFDWAAMGDARTEEEFQARLAGMVEHFIDTVRDVRRAVDWAETRPEIDPQRIALIGFSMSAIVGSIVMATEPRIDAGVLVLGGADLPEILAVCNGRIRQTRENLLKRFGWSLEEFKQQLRGPLAPINPVRFAGRLDPAKLLVIEAAEDSCIPKSARERFWQALGRPERVAYDYDHRMTFLAMTFLGGNNMQGQIYRFLDRVLAPPPVRYQAAENAWASP
jgi:dienelactone hydrolase